MGYSTDFYGELNVSPPLSPAQVAYLKAFGETRRMGRKVSVASEMPDPIREAVNLPIGKQAGYFVGGGGFMGQDEDPSVLDFNVPPEGQPGAWCQWVASDDGTTIGWDGGEKFYEYVEWLEYILDHFLTPWGRTVNGEIEWQGQDNGDRGLIVVTKNKVTTKPGRIVYE